MKELYFLQMLKCRHEFDVLSRPHHVQAQSQVDKEIMTN